jgi:voltage-gated potassium channel
MDYYEPSATQFDQDMIELRGRLRGALAFLLLVTLFGVFGFLAIDPDAGPVSAFFMTAISLTTVGYGEEIPIDTDGARIFTAVLILVGMGGTLFFVSTATAFVLEGQLGNVFRRRKMERELSTLVGHLIVCGSGASARYAARELSTVERKVVLVAPSAEVAESVTTTLEHVLVVVGDPTDDEILRAAGIERAEGLIACSESDNENVVITLTARQLSTRIRIVAQLQDVQQSGKIRKVGANSVVSPYHIGGLRMASELIRPTVVDFLDTMLRDRDRNLRVEEVLIAEGAPAVGGQIRQLGLDDLPGVLLLAVRYKDGRWEYNPSRSSEIHAGETLIFLGSPTDAAKLRARLGARIAGSAARA